MQLHIDNLYSCYTILYHTDTIVLSFSLIGAFVYFVSLFVQILFYKEI